MVHYLRYHWIEPELVDKGGDFGVEDKAFSSAVAITDTADIDAIDDCHWARDGAGG